MRRSTVLLLLFSCGFPMHTLSQQRQADPPEHSFRNFFVYNEGNRCGSRMDEETVKLRAASGDRLLWQFSSICDRRVMVIARPTSKNILECRSSDGIKIGNSFRLEFGKSKSMLCQVPAKPSSAPPYLYEVAYCLIPDNAEDCKPPVRRAHELEIEVPNREP